MKKHILLLLVCGTASLLGQARVPVDREIVAHVLKPIPRPPAVDTLKAPPGFTVAVYAKDVGNARMLAVAENGDVYVTRRTTGDLLRLRDTNRDGVADEQTTVARRPDLHGIALSGKQMYLATVNDVYVATVDPAASSLSLNRIIDDLPDGGQHQNRTLAIGPDGALYISVGSTCNACSESSPESAAMLRATPDGRSRTIFASGLRNTIGFGWQPQTRALFGWDHGIDWLGDDEQGEEFNAIEKGKQYGWPYIYADGKANPQDEPPGELTHEQWARLSTSPVLMYTAHSAPMQMLFYTGAQFPSEFRNDAFVAMHGSWNRRGPSGYEVVRVRFRDGKPAAVEPFVSGFLMGAGSTYTQSGRPTGLAMAPDGSLLFSDDHHGVIYRVSYASRRP